ncbi:MAG: PqqD family protein [Sphingomonas sp.]
MVERSDEPLAREHGLMVRDMHDEVLVYDTQRDRATALNPIAAKVWRACDGASDVPMIVARLSTPEAPIDEESVWKALVLLGKADLLERPHVIHSPAFDRQSRRQIIRKLGTAAMVAVPVVIAISVPTPAQAASALPSGSFCTVGSQCASGLCNFNQCN